VDWKTFAGATVLLLFAIGVLVGFYLLLNTESLKIEIRLPVLAIAGVVALLVALALVAGAFTLFNLANAKEALGLPEGLIIATVPNGAEDEAQRFTIYYRDFNPQGADVAKQLLTLVGTLVRSVASFYFGSKSAVSFATGVVKAGTAPIIRSVSPTTLARGAGADVQISGDGLDLIKEAKITYGGRTVLATGLTSNASLVKCRLDIAATEPPGAWTVTVTDGTGQKTELPGSFAVT
jgi:hypothetical protein